MKKYRVLFIIASVLLSTVLTGCGDNKTQLENKDTATGAVESSNVKAENVVDVDVTALSSVMVYAEVYNMMTRPAEYMGKTVKIRGQYYSDYYDKTGKTYFYVTIADTSECCRQGVEFIWNGAHAYPADYPQEQSEIEITGVFSSYDEDEITYYYLSVDDIIRL